MVGNELVRRPPEFGSPRYINDIRTILQRVSLSYLRPSFENASRNILHGTPMERLRGLNQLRILVGQIQADLDFDETNQAHGIVPDELGMGRHRGAHYQRYLMGMHGGVHIRRF